MTNDIWGEKFGDALQGSLVVLPNRTSISSCKYMRKMEMELNCDGGKSRGEGKKKRNTAPRLDGVFQKERI